MQEAGTTWKKRIDRPLGVYLITSYDFLFVGLVPLITLILFFRHSDAEFSFITTLLSVGLYFVVMGASVWACVGDNIGRWLLLSAVTLTAVMWIINATLILSNMDLASGEKAQRNWFHLPGYYFAGIKLVVLQSQNNSCLLQTKRRILTTCAEPIVGPERGSRVSQLD